MGNRCNLEEHGVILRSGVAAILTEWAFHLENIGPQVTLERDLCISRNQQIDGFRLHDFQRLSLDAAASVILGQGHLGRAAKSKGRGHRKTEYCLKRLAHSL